MTVYWKKDLEVDLQKTRLKQERTVYLAIDLQVDKENIEEEIYILE